MLVPLALAAIVAAAPVAVEENGPELDFSYSWSAEAAAVPFLDRRFRADLNWMKEEALKYAAEDAAAAKADGRDFNGHYFSRGWETAGQSERLLSLQGATGTFTGGAHPNSSYSAILWDRAAGSEITLADLFADPDAPDRLLRKPFCVALDKQRLEKREGERLEGQFSECPAFKELAISPTDERHDGRFEKFVFLAGPYVAGPYAEGEYEVAVPLTPALIAALKPEYRASFEVQRQ